VAAAFFAEPSAATLPSRLRRKKNCAICFAFSLPQDSSAQLMFDLAGFGGRGLSRSLRFEFRVDRRGSRARRRACRTSASQHTGFRATRAPLPSHAAQALQVAGFFASSARCVHANCLTLPQRA
jgi:hypothetical protein